MLEKLREIEIPAFLAGSQPCTDFCKLLHLRLRKEEIADRQEKHGKPFVRTCDKPYWKQFAMGTHPLHEHPSRAGSWKTFEIKEAEADQ